MPPINKAVKKNSSKQLPVADDTILIKKIEEVISKRETDQAEKKIKLQQRIKEDRNLIAESYFIGVAAGLLVGYILFNKIFGPLGGSGSRNYIGFGR